MSKLRTVKKYSNRRLYDMTTSRYDTLLGLYARVVDGADLQVIDAVTNEDITGAILFQMMSAKEKTWITPSMSHDFLLQVIRSGAQLQGRMIATFLEQSLKLFTTLQAEQERPGSEVDTNPLPATSRLAEANYARWRSVRSQIYQTVADAEFAELATDGRRADDITPIPRRRPPRLRRSRISTVGSHPHATPARRSAGSPGPTESDALPE